MPSGGARPGAGRPKGSFKQGVEKRCQVRLPNEAWAKIDALAQKRGVTRSEILRALILKGLELVDGVTAV